MGCYRLNIRLNQDEPDEQRIAEYLRNYAGSRNRLVIKALNEYIENETGGETTFFGRIRKIIREELENSCVSFPVEERHDDGENSSVLEDLELFE